MRKHFNLPLHIANRDLKEGSFKNFSLQFLHKTLHSVLKHYFSVTFHMIGPTPDSFWFFLLSSMSFCSDKQNRDLHDGILHSVAQLVTSQITDRLSTVMMNEIPRHILPVIHTQLEKMKVQMLADVGQKLRSCDQVIKESIMNVTSSKVWIIRNLKRNVASETNFFFSNSVGIDGNIWKCCGCRNSSWTPEDLLRHIENNHYSVVRKNDRGTIPTNSIDIFARNQIL